MNSQKIKAGRRQKSGSVSIQDSQRQFTLYSREVRPKKVYEETRSIGRPQLDPTKEGKDCEKQKMEEKGLVNENK